MNAAKAKMLLPLIQAFAEGKTIQMNHGMPSKPDWVDTKWIKADFPSEFYRIKPEPVIKEGFFVMWDDGVVSPQFSKPNYALAMAAAHPTARRKATHIGHLVIKDGVPSMTFSEYVPPTT